MTTINENTKVADIDELAPLMPYLMYQVQMMGKPAVELSFAQMLEEQPTWSTESMVCGTQRLVSLAERGQLLYDVYEAQECVDDPRKAEIKLIRMAAGEPDPTKPFVIGVAGGAYTCVCSLVESIPVAAQLNSLGYQVFILNYRCGKPPVAAGALTDLAAAVRFVLSHKADFGIESDDYVVNGFSAGANLSSLWGTEAVGWAHYGLPKPKALFLMYPFVSFDCLEPGPMTDFMRGLMFGAEATTAVVEAYDTARLVTDQYPPCYLGHAEDDPVVSVRNSRYLAQLLQARGIPAQAELIATGGHGWGDGTGTDAAGWVTRAAAFVEGL